MINLTDTQFGQKRRLIIGGLNSFDIFAKSINVTFYIQIVDAQGNLLEDKSIVQNRRVVYNVNNQNFVNIQFDPVPEGTPGAKMEYDYFWELLQTTPLPTLVLQLAQKLITRNIFN